MTAVFGFAKKPGKLAPLWGIASLDDSVVHERVMDFLKTTIEWLRAGNVHEVEGIFRKAAPEKRLAEIIKTSRKSRDLGLTKNEDVHTVATLLKRFFREMTAPILTFELYSTLIAADNEEDDEKRKQNIKQTLTLLSANHRTALEFLFRYLHELSMHSGKTFMTSQNLAIVFGPNLLRPLKETPLVLISDATHVTDVTASFIDDPSFYFGSTAKKATIRETIQFQAHMHDAYKAHRKESKMALNAMITQQSETGIDAFKKKLEDLSSAIREGKFEGLSFIFDNNEEPEADYEPVLSRSAARRPEKEEKKGDNLVFGIKSTLLGREKSDKEKTERKEANKLRASHESSDDEERHSSHERTKTETSEVDPKAKRNSGKSGHQRRKSDRPTDLHKSTSPSPSQESHGAKEPLRASMPANSPAIRRNPSMKRKKTIAQIISGVAKAENIPPHSEPIPSIVDPHTESPLIRSHGSRPTASSAPSSPFSASLTESHPSSHSHSHSHSHPQSQSSSRSRDDDSDDHEDATDALLSWVVVDMLLFNDFSAFLRATFPEHIVKAVNIDFAQHPNLESHLESISQLKRTNSMVNRIRSKGDDLAGALRLYKEIARFKSLQDDERTLCGMRVFAMCGVSGDPVCHLPSDLLDDLVAQNVDEFSATMFDQIYAEVSSKLEQLFDQFKASKSKRR